MPSMWYDGVNVKRTEVAPDDRRENKADQGTDSYADVPDLLGGA